jgi:hypothetical protein
VKSAAALALYAALAAVLVWHGASLTREIWGMGSDPMAFVWFLAWWPHALAAHINPLHTALVWQPLGVDLPWTTCVPLLALLAAPVTLSLGPLASYNLLTAAAPALAAFGAYALGVEVARSRLAGFCAGLVYGFSSYEMAENLEHLNLDFTVFVPLLLLVVLRRVEGRLTRVQAAALFAVLLAAQFYVSVEVAFSALLFGGLAWVLALRLMPAQRPALLRLPGDGALAGVLAVPLLAPFLWDMLTVPRAVLIPLTWSWRMSAHLGHLFATTPGAVFYIPDLPDPGLLPEADFAAGLGLVAVLAAFAWRFWREARGRLILAVFGLTSLLSLGPLLWLGFTTTHVPLPWILAMRLPLLQNLIPDRFALYAMLALALAVALFVGGSRRRAALAVGAWALTLAPPHVVTPAPYAAFFQPGHVQAALGADAKVVVLPDADRDPSTFWQAQSGFAFAQSSGYFGMPPARALDNPAVRSLATGLPVGDFVPALANFAQATGARYVLAGPGARADLVAALTAAQWPARQDEDVTIFTVPETTH